MDQLFIPYERNKYMLFAGWEVCMVKNCDRGLENTARGRRPRAAFSRHLFMYEDLPLFMK